MSAPPGGAKQKWQEFPALEATRRMNSLNNPAMFEGLASSQIAFAAAMADMMRSKDGDAKPKAKQAAPSGPAAFDKDMLARLAQQAAEAPQYEEEEPEPVEPAAPAGFQLPPGFSLVSFDTEEEAAQALEEMDEEPPPPATSFAKASPAERDWWSENKEPPSSSASGPARGWGRSFEQEQRSANEFGTPRGEAADPMEKTVKVKNILDNVMGRAAAAAASSAACAAVAPPVPKAAPPSSRAQAAEVPGGNDIYLPASATQPGRAPQEKEDDRSRAEDKSWDEIRRRREGSRPRSPARRRSGSRRRGRSGDRARRPEAKDRRRSRSGGAAGGARRSRSRGAKRDRGGFSSSAGPAKDAAKSGAIEPVEKASNNKFSDTASVQLKASPNDVPDWLKDLAEPQIPRALLGRKVLRMPDAYIKCLIGRGGETIRQIINKTGADIRIEAKQDNLDGIVSIANNIEAAEKLIKEILASKGCHWQTQRATDMGGELTNVGWKGHVDDDDLQIPTELVGLFIGNAGAGIKEIKARVGGAVTIKVLPPLLPGGFQVVQVVGENWKAAREVVRQKIKQILQETPGRWHAPGFSPSNPNLGGGGGGGGGGGAANAGYMPGFGATPGMSYSREALREGNTTNVVHGTSL